MSFVYLCTILSALLLFTRKKQHYYFFTVNMGIFQFIDIFVKQLDIFIMISEID